VPHVLSETAGVADYPVLLQKDKQMFLLWNTGTDGLKVLAL